MSSVAIVRQQISWFAVVCQLVAIGCVIAITSCVLGMSNGMKVGVALYLVYSIVARRLIARAHRRGMRLFVRKKYDEAIKEFENSYEFFSCNVWIDRYQSITLMWPSAMSYREMALCNIAYCYSQLRKQAQAEQYYRRTLQEFPNGSVAAEELRMMKPAG